MLPLWSIIPKTPTPWHSNPGQSFTSVKYWAKIIFVPVLVSWVIPFCLLGAVVRADSYIMQSGCRQRITAYHWAVLADGTIDCQLSYHTAVNWLTSRQPLLHDQLGWHQRKGKWHCPHVQVYKPDCNRISEWQQTSIQNFTYTCSIWCTDKSPLGHLPSHEIWHERTFPRQRNCRGGHLPLLYLY